MKLKVSQLAALMLALAALLVQGGDACGDMALGEHRAAGLALLAAAVVLGGAAIAMALRVPAPNLPVRSSRLRWLLAALLLLHAGIAFHLMRASDRDSPPNGPYSASDPRNIDCYTFQLEAAKDLLHGINPYGTTQPNIYNADQTRRFYGHGMVINGRVQVGFQYPPISFLAALPGYLLGDVRYGYLAAVLLAAVFAFATVPNLTGFSLAAYLLLNPLTFMVEDRCWTEPLVWMLLCATLYTALRRPRWLPLALGLFLASKQYNFLALPLIGALVLPYSWKAHLRLIAISVAIAVVTLLPFALINFHALWHDLVLFHLAQPLRPDALSFAIPFPSYQKIGLFLLLVFVAWVARPARGRPALFPAAFGISLLLFVTASKQAFLNYYFLIGQALLLAAAMLWSTSIARVPMPDQKDYN